MTRYVMGTLIVVVIAGVGCAARSVERGQGVPPPVVQLMHPPDVPDPHYPGGVHVKSDAPLASWQRDAVFATLEACESSRIHRIDDAIDKARAEVGEKAKFQLPVRRAVQARCVSPQ